MGVSRFSSREIPSDRRAARYREILNAVLKLEVTSLDGAPLEVETAIRLLPGGLVVARSDLSPLSMNRTARHVADGNDNLILSIPLVGSAVYRVAGRELVCKPGEAFICPGDEPSLIENGEMSRLSLSIPRKLLAPTMHACVDATPRQLHNTPALILLSAYANILAQEPFDPLSRLQTLVAGHIRDLVAASMEPDAAGHAPNGRPGIRAARLHIIKDSIRHRLRRSDLSLDGIARLNGISPRYVQSLFQDETTTFRDYVLAERLALAREQLCDPTLAGRTISDVAYSCGFGDLSYFNHTFRRRFGMTPGDARRGSRV